MTDAPRSMRWLSDVRLALCVVLAVVFLWATFQVDLVIFAGVLLAVFLHGLAETASRRARLAYPWALGAVVVVIGVVVIGVAYLFAQAAADQVDQLSARVSGAITHLESQLNGMAWGRALIADAKPQQMMSGGGVGRIFGVASNAVTVVGAVVVIAFFGIYMAAEPRAYERGLVLLVPPASRARVRQILSATGDLLWYWMLGRLFSMAVVGACTSLGLWAIGMPLPFALGGVAGVLTFIPYLGAIASAVPALIIALSLDLQQALWVALLYLGVHILEGYILVPLVQRRAVHLPPAVTLAGQLILGVLAGVPGVIFATPLVAALITLVRMAYVEDVLGDRS